MLVKKHIKEAHSKEALLVLRILKPMVLIQTSMTEPQK